MQNEMLCGVGFEIQNNKIDTRLGSRAAADISFGSFWLNSLFVWFLRKKLYLQGSRRERERVQS